MPGRGRNVTAVLGPTNTGKTHLAIERMLAQSSGVIGLPLRLLAREVYGRVVARAGKDAVALITGEEKILPPNARYHVATVEAMPLDLGTDFLAIDEVQLAADLERGRVFTDRLLRARGTYETLLLGALTARKLLEKLIPGINVVTRPRMSVLTYQGEKKLTRLPPRSAVVAFSANEVYAVAELIRRQRGGAAIVMGALSPRTRNAQVELFQSGDVDFLVATDAIGMGLNLDVDHVAFASNRKFDGYQHRLLSAAELGQIAGRAGRHTRDGTFGVTSRVPAFAAELVEALETHAFAPAKVFQWRNPSLDFSSLDALRRSLDEPAREEGLTKAPPADDQKALEHAVKTPAVQDTTDTPARVERLWEVCQVPDYRKIAPANHADLILTLHRFLVEDGVIADDWIARQVQYADRTDGDIDTLSNRIAHVRTWTFVANRNDWLSDAAEWRETTRKVEDRLSDALHERLMQRFVDRRTSVLMKRLRENAMLESEVNDAGDVMVEGQHVGVLHGFRFQADSSADDPRDQKALRAAAAKALTKEMDRRAEKVASAPDAAFVLGSDAGLRWQGGLIAKLSAAEDPLKPQLLLLADDILPAPARERVEARLSQWVSAHIQGLLKPLFDLHTAEGLEAGARGLAYRIAENYGSLERSAVAAEAKALEQSARAGLRALGVRFGAYHIFVPALLKPAPSQLLALLWALKNADMDVKGLQEVPQLSASGRTSIPVDPEIPPALYGVVGFRVCGPRAVRIDILERLADQVRPLVAWRPGPDAGDPPPGAVPSGGAFLVTVTMTSLLGCSGEDFAAVLTSLGYRVERREANDAESAALAAAQKTRKGAARPEVKAAAAPKISASESEPAAGGEGDPTDPGAVLVDTTADLRTGPGAGDAEHTAAAPGPTPAGGPADGDSVGDEVGGEQAATLQAQVAPDHPQDGGAADTTDATAVRMEPAEDRPADGPPEPEAAPSPASEVGSPPASPVAVIDVAPSALTPDPQTAMVADAATPSEGQPQTEVENPADDDAPTASDSEQTEANGEPEPVIIEIWRVPRHHRPADGQRRRHSPRQRVAGESGQPQQRRRRKPGAATGTTDHAQSGRNDEAQSSTSALPGQPSGKGRPAKKAKKRHKGSDRAPRPEARSEPRKQREADPDSPFAALAALKEQLEKGPGDS
ncbi:MAG: helicase-related protein [Pseudomonadota bacterium]